MEQYTYTRVAFLCIYFTTHVFAIAFHVHAHCLRIHHCTFAFCALVLVTPLHFRFATMPLPAPTLLTCTSASPPPPHARAHTCRCTRCTLRVYTTTASKHYCIYRALCLRLAPCPLPAPHSLRVDIVPFSFFVLPFSPRWTAPRTFRRYNVPDFTRLVRTFHTTLHTLHCFYVGVYARGCGHAAGAHSTL